MTHTDPDHSEDLADPQRWAPLVYDELRAMARRQMRGEAGITLQTTVLVHEVYLRLFAGKVPEWDNRAHFFGSAARCMRQILIDHARARRALCRGEGRRGVALDGLDVAAPERDESRLLSLHHALERLEARDPRKAQIVLLRYFAGLTIEQTADVLDVSPTTVKDEWRFARAWLLHDMNHEERDE